MMLPSTGHFKSINCPFFDSGLCERPYCHYRHVKKDTSSSTIEANGEILEHLVSEAVKKVLKQKEMLPVQSAELDPQEVEPVPDDGADLPPDNDQSTVFQPSQGVPSYKPTPIAELNKKRHIPVPYTPRNCSIVQPKRQKSSENLNPVIKRLKLNLEPSKNATSTEYNPDVDTNKCVGYSPCRSDSLAPINHSYIPSSIATLKPVPTDYIPVSTSIDVNSGKDQITYEPSGAKLKEPEYQPLAETSNIINDYVPTDKTMLGEINFEDLEPEFEMLDELINEHALLHDRTFDGDSISRKYSEFLNSDSSTGILEEFKTNEINELGVPVDNLVVPSEISNFSDINDEPFISDAPIEIVNQNGFLPLTSLHTSSKSSKSTSKIISSNEKKDKSEKDRHHSKSTKHGRSSSSSSKSHHKSKSKSSSKSSSKHKDTDKHRSKSSKSSSSKSSSSKHNDSKSKSSSSSKSHHRKSSTKLNGSSSSSKSSKPAPVKEEEVEIDSGVQISEASDNDACSIGSESDEEEITQECFRIFQAYTPDMAEDNTKKSALQKDKVEEVEKVSTSSGSKHRTAHEGVQRLLPKKAAPSKSVRQTPSQILAKRYEDVKALFKKKKEGDKSDVSQKLKDMKSKGLFETNLSKYTDSSKEDANMSVGNPTSTSGLAGGKLRIAHVPNVTGLLQAKTRVNTAIQRHTNRENIMKRNAAHILQTTVAQTTSKGSQRVAHTPSTAMMELPMIQPEPNMKIPASCRQIYLELFIKEYLMWMDTDLAYVKALEAEKIAYDNCKSRMLYTSSVSKTIMRLRKEHGHQGIKNNSNTVSHASMLTKNMKGSWSVVATKKPSLGSLYDHLERYILTEEQLKLNSFPRSNPDTKGSALCVRSHYDKDLPWEGNERVCVRCNRRYSVDVHGLQNENEDCVYHHGRLFRSEYNCCNGGVDASGCMISPCHVTHTFQMTNYGYLRTLPCYNEPENGDYGVYALDCEMCYTTKGMELIRVTVIDRNLKTVFEKMVMPENPILDYCTRFSGVTEQDLEGVTTSIFQIQAALLGMFNDKTILIGHSLDSDLRALKIIHGTVVDTSIVFPHREGPPKKRALRNLASLILRKVIQQGEGGHDSAEDALVAMELMLFKVKEDIKLL